jgi:hypothetical protein
MSASNSARVQTVLAYKQGRGGDGLTKARLMYLLIVAAFFAYLLAALSPNGMSDGGGF